jgi:hypothetical protein
LITLPLKGSSTVPTLVAGNAADLHMYVTADPLDAATPSITGSDKEVPCGQACETEKRLGRTPPLIAFWNSKIPSGVAIFKMLR